MNQNCKAGNNDALDEVRLARLARLARFPGRHLSSR